MPQIAIREVLNGEHDGEIVWVCDYRYIDPNNKPIRHLRPTKVLIRPITDTKTRVNYSLSYFSPLNAKGKVTSKIIKPLDNTGYRGYSGVALAVFSDEQSCIDHYKNQCSIILKMFEDEREVKIKYFDEKIQELKMVNESDNKIVNDLYNFYLSHSTISSLHQLTVWFEEAGTTMTLSDNRLLFHFEVFDQEQLLHAKLKYL